VLIATNCDARWGRVRYASQFLIMLKLTGWSTHGLTPTAAMFVDDCRRCEHHYRRMYSVADRRQWVEAARPRFQLFTAVRRRRTGPVVWNETDVHRYSSGDGCRRCFVTIKTLPVPPAHCRYHRPYSRLSRAEGFEAFFARQVDKVRTATAAAPLPDVADTAPASLSFFQLCNEALLCHRWSNSALLIRRGPSYCVSMLTCFRRT